MGIPTAFAIRGPRTTRVVADFAGSAFVPTVLGLLRREGFVLIHRPDLSIEDCEDPWVCCIHPRPEP